MVSGSGRWSVVSSNCEPGASAQCGGVKIEVSLPSWRAGVATQVKKYR